MSINVLVWIPAADVDEVRRGPARDNVTFGRAVNNGRTIDFMVRTEADIDALLGRNAQLVGAWDFFTGEKVRPMNRGLYLQSQPDEVTHDEDGNIVSRQRPTEHKLTHVWSGQAPRDLS